MSKPEGRKARTVGTGMRRSWKAYRSPKKLTAEEHERNRKRGKAG